jgi:hypothetical protein
MLQDVLTTIISIQDTGDPTVIECPLLGYRCQVAQDRFSRAASHLAPKGQVITGMPLEWLQEALRAYIAIGWNGSLSILLSRQPIYQQVRAVIAHSFEHVRLQLGSSPRGIEQYWKSIMFP